MKKSTLRILGASGGFGKDLRTTSFLLDEDILIDAGTGVGDLSLSELSKIDHVFLTHCHLDHIASLPFLLDAVGGQRSHPVTAYALPETIESLKKHIVNNAIWPDFTCIPSAEKPFLRFQAIGLGDRFEINGREIRPLPANHTVAAVGYLITSETGEQVAFTGDSVCSEQFWAVLNQLSKLKHLIIETSFTDEQAELAELSKHLNPQMLIDELKNFRISGVTIHITHLKPGLEAKTMGQIEVINSSKLDTHQIKILRKGISF
jgi:cAMP phosphodiesterase